MNAKKTLIAVGIAAVMPLSMAAKPAELPDKANGNANGLGCELANGSEYDSPGKMFQHLRNREDGNVAGNPKDVADAYAAFDGKVSNLVDIKCGS